MHFYKYSAVSIFQKSNLFNVLYFHFCQTKLAARTIPAAKILFLQESNFFFINFMSALLHQRIKFRLSHNLPDHLPDIRMH